MTIIGDWSHSGHLVMCHHSGGQERVISLSGNKDDYTLDHTLHAQYTSSHCLAVFHPPGTMASPATEDTIKAPIEEENC